MERRRLEEMDPEALESFRNGWCHGQRGVPEVAHFSRHDVTRLT